MTDWQARVDANLCLRCGRDAAAMHVITASEMELRFCSGCRDEIDNRLAGKGKRTAGEILKAAGVRT